MSNTAITRNLSDTKKLNLSAMLKESKPIYVRNKLKGILALTVYESNGRANRLTVPRTKHPVCLSDKATPYALENSASIRKALATSAIELLSPEVAESELNNPTVQRELAIATRRCEYNSDDVLAHRKASIDDRNNDAAQLASRVVTDISELDKIQKAGSNPHAEIGEAQSEEQDDEPNERQAAKQAKVNTRVVVMCAELAEKQMKSREAKMELENISEDLTIDDLDYIVQNASGIVQTWATEMLAMRRTDIIGGDSDIEDADSEDM